MDFVLFKVCNSRIEADILKGFLESEGIAVIEKADDAGGMLPMLTALNGVGLYIPKNDLKRAQEIITTQ